MAPSVMRTPWWISYFSFRPRRMAMVSSTVGSLTSTGWKRRSERGVLLDVLAVLVERGGADGMQLAASQRRLQHIARVHGSCRRAAPAPTMVCSSSMNRMMLSVGSASPRAARPSSGPRTRRDTSRRPPSRPGRARRGRGPSATRAHRRPRCAGPGPRRWRSCRCRARR